MLITAKELAARLDGRTYSNELTQQDIDEAGDAGLVIVFSTSEDSCTLEGAIRHEMTLPRFEHKVELRFSRDGDILCGGDVDVETMNAVRNMTGIDVLKLIEANTAKFDAVWLEGHGNKDETAIPWTYRVRFPHKTFRIYENDGIYCVGFVFDLDDALPPNRLTKANLTEALQDEVRRFCEPLVADALISSFSAPDLAAYMGKRALVYDYHCPATREALRRLMEDGEL